jgi:hypothetical protein
LLQPKYGYEQKDGDVSTMLRVALQTVPESVLRTFASRVYYVVSLVYLQQDGSRQGASSRSPAGSAIKLMTDYAQRGVHTHASMQLM